MKPMVGIGAKALVNSEPIGLCKSTLTLVYFTSSMAPTKPLAK